jgi:hypothetical protein
MNVRNDDVRSLTFGAYLTHQWLPGKRLSWPRAPTAGTSAIERHILPAVGAVGLRRLRPQHLEALDETMLTPHATRPALSPKTVYEVHLVIRGPRRHRPPRSPPPQRRAHRTCSSAAATGIPPKCGGIPYEEW